MIMLEAIITEGSSGIEGVGEGSEEVEGLDVGVDAFGLGIAWGLGPVKKGTKLTFPRLKSFLKS